MGKGRCDVTRFQERVMGFHSSLRHRNTEVLCYLVRYLQYPTVLCRGMKTGISEASKRVTFFIYIFYILLQLKKVE